MDSWVTTSPIPRQWEVGIQRSTVKGHFNSLQQPLAQNQMKLQHPQGPVSVVLLTLYSRRSFVLFSESEKMVVAAKLSYEESRRKRLEENKKRMEALNLPQLSQALRNSSSPKPSPLKHVKSRTIQKEVVVVRRSSRVANMPAPVYKEVVIDRVAIPRRIYNKHRDLSNRVYASDEAREEAIEKAEKLQSDFESEYPTFMKSMLQSHISGGFWLGLPVHFCKKNLPKKDEVITLIDEDGDEYPTIYLPRKTGLSGGWKGFAVAHNLADGDALVFQLIRCTAFKVYIVRADSPGEGK